MFRKNWVGIAAGAAAAFALAIGSVGFAQTVKIMPLGDSITQGSGNGMSPPYNSFRKPLASLLANASISFDLVGTLSDGDGTFDQNHDGHPGFTADQIASGISSYLTNTDPGIVLVHAGTNDITSGETNSSTLTDITNIVDGIRSYSANAKILLGGIIPRFDSATLDSLTRDLNSQIIDLINQKKAAGYKIRYVDHYNVFKSNSNWQTDYMSDGVHPNNAGYQIMANTYFTAIQSALNQSGSGVVDDFNRPGPGLGANWSANAAYQIVSNQLANTSTQNAWTLATWVANTNPIEVSFKWANNADALGINEGGLALRLSAPSFTASGYLVWLGTSAGAGKRIFLWTIVNGAPSTSIQDVGYSQPDPVAGSVFKVTLGSDASGHYFDCYINDVFYGRVVDAAKSQGNGAPLYAGVMVNGNNLNNDIDDFNLVTGVSQDVVAPATTTDLTVQSVGETSVTLRWTAPGDDGTSGTATQYEVRYSTSSINSGNFSSAQLASNPPTPSVAGTTENMTIFGLSSGTTYYFALKTRDEAGNSSGLSNVPSASMPTGLPTVDAFDRANLGANWTAHAAFAIINGELHNTSTENSWNFMAVYSAKKNPIEVGLKWGTTANAAGIDEGGFALRLSAASTTASGYLLWRRPTTGTIDLWTIVNGAPGAPIAQATGQRPAPVAGDEIRVALRSDANGHHFDVFINNQYDGTVSDPGKVQGTGSNLYAGVMLHGNRNNPIDNFRITNILGAPSQLLYVSGNAQTDTVGQKLPQPFVVKVADNNDNPISGQTVSFQVTQGNGSIETPAVFNVRVDVGASGSFIDNAGNTWQADRAYSAGSYGYEGGRVGQTASPIANTIDDQLYQTERFGLSSYKVDVPNGSYTVILHFCEFVYTQANRRVFNVRIEGTSVLSNFDIFVQAGGRFVALSKTFNVSVTDGTLNIDFQDIIELPEMVALEVLGAQGGAVSGSDGLVSRYFILGTTLGAHQVTVSPQSFTAPPVIFTATAVAGGPAKIVKVSGDNQSAAGGGTLTQPFVVTVSDIGDNPIQGYGVNFVVTQGGGTLSNTQPVLADAQGQASTVLTLGREATTQTVEAQAPGLTGSPVVFTATATSGVASALQMVSGNNQTGTVATTLPNPIIAKIVDGGGAAVPNYPVEMTITRGGGSVSAKNRVLNPGFEGAKTGSNPYAPENWQLHATPSANEVDVVTTEKHSGAKSVRINANAESEGIYQPISLNANTSYTLKFWAKVASGTLRAEWRVSDAVGNPVISELRVTAAANGNVWKEYRMQATNVVAFSGNLYFVAYGAVNCYVDDVQVLQNTDAQGQVSATWTLGDTAMVQKVEAKAFAAGNPLSGSPLVFSATATAAAAKNMALFSGNNQTGSAGAPLAQPFKVKITDQYGNAKAGTNVNFLVTAGGGTFAGGVSSVDLASDSTGIAQATLTLGPTAGATNTVQASSTGLTGSPITFTATAAVPSSFAKTNGDNQIASASLLAPTPLTVRIASASNDPIANYDVLFEVIQGNGKINGLASTTLKTDANGEAKANLLLDPTPGVVNKVRASATYNSAPISGSPATFTITAAKLTTLSIVSGNGQTGAVGLPLPQPLKAAVLDSLGNGIKGQNIVFTIVAGGGKLDGTYTARTVQSDSLGAGKVSLTLGTAVGTDNNRVTAEASFNGTALAGSPALFTASGVAGSPSVLKNISGDGQTGVVNNQLPNPLRVQVTDAFDAGVYNFLVKFKIKSGGGKVNGADSVSVNTDSSGFAQVTMTVGSTSGLNNNICEVVAKNGPVHLTNSPMLFTATATASTARNMAMISGNNQTGTAGTALPDSFVVKVTDAIGNPVAGHPVTFNVIAGSGRLNGTVDTVKTASTNGIGEAKVKLTLGPMAGANNNTVRAAANDGFNPLNGSPIDFTASAIAGPPNATVSSVQATTPVPANGTDLSNVTITVRDNSGNPLEGIALTILVSGSNNLVNPVTQLTDAQGVTTGSFSSTRAEVKRVTARVIGGIEITNGAQVTFTPLAAAKLVPNGGNNQTGNVGTALPIPLSAKVTDINDNAIPGHPVTFSVQSGGGYFVQSQPVLTDATGFANATFVLGPNTGTNIASASATGLSGSPITFSATGVNNPAANLVEVSGNDQSGVAGQSLPQPIVARVTDSAGRPLYNYLVKFKVIFGGGKVNNSDSTSVQTDAFGNASAIWKMGAEAGSNFCNAIAPGLTGSPLTFRAIAASGQAVYFRKTNGDGAVGTVATMLGEPLTVRVEDTNNNGVSNVRVLFSLTQGSGSLSATEVYTNEGGYASVNLTFGTSSGERKVVATSTGLQPSSLTFTVTARAAAATSMSIHGGQDQTGTVNKPLNFPLSVIVRDQYGNPVEGTSISFVIAAGGGNFSGLQVKNVSTGADGIASTVWTLGAAPGANQARAINNQLSGSPLVFNAAAFTNNFPVITDIPDFSIRENDHIEFTVDARDDDGDPLTYGAKNLPRGSVFDSLGTHLFSWTPDYSSAGIYNISFVARDNKGGVDEEIVTVSVANVNRPPQIVSHNPVRSDTTLASGTNLLMKVNATDPDGDGLGYAWFDNDMRVSSTNTYLLLGSVNAKVSHHVIVMVYDQEDTTKFTWNIVTRVELSSFSASLPGQGLSDDRGVLLRWTTASEFNNAGFHVLRSRSHDGTFERLNARLVAHRRDGEYSFVDREVEVGNRYYYKLQDVDLNGLVTEHGPVSVVIAAPENYALSQNYPNPFNPATRISFKMPESGQVALTIYNILGQPVRTLVQGEKPAGYHTLEWDGRNDRGEMMPSGIYHYRLQASAFVETKKMVLMK